MLHGLGGNGAKSWSGAATKDFPESSWLRDVLLAENKNARVMLFSYPSFFEDGDDVLSTPALVEASWGLLATYKAMSPVAGRGLEDKDPVLSQVFPPNLYREDTSSLLMPTLLRRSQGTTYANCIHRT